MTLTYPWFLLGLISLLIPVAIHLFELRRPQRVLFTNVSFIQEVKLITAKQRKLKHLLLLLSRLAFLFFLVLLFCQPFIPSPNQEKENAGRVGVLLDNSASMQAEGNNNQSLFEQAIEQGRDLTSAYPTTAQFELNSSRTALASAAYRAALEQLAISTQSRSVEDELAKYDTQGTGQPKQLFIFSDFQKSTFSSKSLSSIDSAQQVFLVPLAGKQMQNVYVDSVLLDDAFVRANTDLVLRIRLRNGGNQDVANCQGKLFIGDKQAAVFRATVLGGQAVTSTVRIRLENMEQQQCYVTLEDYPVTFDNDYFFTLQAAPKINILGLATTSESDIQRLYSNESLFSYANVSPQRIEYGRLAGATMILLNEVPQLEAGLRDNLRRAVQQGGSLVVVPPTSTTARASYSQLFRDLGLGALQWETAPSGAPVLSDVAMPDLQNPFFRNVFSGRTRQTALARAAPVLRWSRSENTILQLRNGDGYLAQFSSGKGKVFVFAAPFSGGYSDFTSQALFVPVMYRLAMQSYRNDEKPAYRLNQGVVTLTLPENERGNTSAEQVLKLTNDSLTFIPTQRIVNNVLQLEIPPGMTAPGFYKLTRDGQTITQLAFNVDKRESELATYSPAELRQLIGPNHPAIQIYDASNGESVAARYRTERVGTPLWRYCLWLALACLLIEVLLLRFMGRQTPAVRPAEAVAA